ncbi:response regulator [Flavobacterium sp.]|uniref:response regulator n=1 Tax=Flavobacterium sp. TaxID=239 RepID=UPI003D2E6D76
MKLIFVYRLFFIIAICLNGYGQNNVILPVTESSIEQQFITAKDFIKKSDFKSYKKGAELIDQLEEAVEKSKNIKLILSFYRQKSLFLFENYDYETALSYIHKSIELLKNNADDRTLGFNYELLGVIKNTQEKFKERDKAFIKAEELLSKSASKEENIDINFNLSFVYKEYKDWQKVIDYSKTALYLIEETNQNESRRRYLNLFVAESYLELEDYKMCSEYLKRVEQDSYFLPDQYLLMASYFKIKGDLFNRIGDFKQASSSYNLSSDFYQKMSLLRTNEIKKTLKLTHSLQLKEVENNRIKSEIQLNKVNSNYKNFILILSAIITSILIFLVFYLYNTSRFRSKVNKILEKNNAELIEKNAEIKKALSVKNKFLDTITHELRTPLNTIKGITYLLKESNLKQNEKEYVYNLEFSSNYLLGLINNIIDYDLIEGVSPNQLVIKDYNLKRLILNIISTFKLSNTNNNTFDCEIDSYIPKRLSFDALKLAQILINLIENSNKYTFNGTIKLYVSLLRVEVNTCIIEFKLEDSGIKIPQEIQNYFYSDSVFQTDTIDKEKHELGIVIIKRNMNLYESKLVFDNSKPIGNELSFVLNFKLFEETNNTFSLSEINQDSRMHILLVEDNKVNQIITKKILSKLGFSCDVADDGLIALNKVKANDYSLILMDIMMPVMDGFESSKEITKIKPNIPIIALTAISKDVNKSKFDETNIKEVITKPVDVDLMKKTIYKYI